ncbi:protein PLASTID TRANSCRIPTIONALLY ACTIVE 16, chloroplastic-like [Capsicum annuum]|uniref:protein PLASTID TRANSCRIPTIONALLY ACTIVE 16, chloroplastic-like n=1 Tax=Capsicum annuum TaxID=4072 RepID=UPI001FB0960E|nr:protein PLASTID TRANSCRIPTIONALLY ACTIVE 16, chloroplastic-like [Capsicum annuum]
MTSLIPASPNTSSGLSFGRQKAKDPGKVFGAGATGQVGIRIAQILLCEFYSVRVGVSDLGATQELARLAISYKVSKMKKEIKKVMKTLNLLEKIFGLLIYANINSFVMIFLKLIASRTCY